MTSTISNGVSSTLKRTSSFANALRSLAGNIAFPSTEDGRSSPKTQTVEQERTEIVQGVSRPPSPNLNFAQYTSPYSRPESPQDEYKQMMHSPVDPHPGTLDFLPCNVLEALMEEDMERLRARRRVNGHSKHHGYSQHREDGFNGGVSPSGSTFSVDSNIILGLGTGVGIRDVLPLKSRFYDWCCEYFKEPQMRVRSAS